MVGASLAICGCHPCAARMPPCASYMWLPDWDTWRFQIFEAWKFLESTKSENKHVSSLLLELSAGFFTGMMIPPLTFWLTPIFLTEKNPPFEQPRIWTGALHAEGDVLFHPYGHSSGERLGSLYRHTWQNDWQLLLVDPRSNLLALQFETGGILQTHENQCIIYMNHTLSVL